MSAVSVTDIDAPSYRLQVSGAAEAFFRYNDIPLRPPSIEIERTYTPLVSRDLKVVSNREVLPGVREIHLRGTVVAAPVARIGLSLRIAAASPILRFRYRLTAQQPIRLTRATGRDQVQLLGLPLPEMTVAEQRFSEFSRLFHTYMPTRHPVDSRHFANHQALMGPMLIFSNGDATGMIAYEHGSEAPDAFLEFVLTPDQGAILRAVKGAYEHGQTVDSAQAWQSPWLQIGAVSGGEDALAETYRTWALKWQCPYAESRKPYIFYRSRAIPDRDSESSEARTLAEIEVARRIGIDVFVLDDHWYEKFGAWQVSARRFPHGLAPIKSRLDEYGMKLGLGLAPPFAALSPDAATGSVDAFADTLIRLHREVGATYFRWAGIEQYSSGTPAETQGTPENAIEERRTCHAFLQSRSLTRIVDRLAAVCPDAIVDLDIAAPERCMGLEFLSAGKYSVGSDDARHRDPKAPEAHATRAAARRIAVEYDRWLPGTLFQTHFLLDDLPGTTDPRANQDLAIASLALGPSGVGGDLLALSDEGVEHLGTALNAYKRVRHDITETSPIREGVPGGSPEIHEKLHPVSGRGLVSLFAARPGTYRYITHRRVAESAVHNDGIRIRRASDGRAIIEATFLPNQWAKWIFFGAA